MSGIGPRLRQLRQARGLSLDKASRDIGMTKGYLSRVEAGLSEPGIRIFAALAGYYRLSLDDLYYGEQLPDGWEWGE